MGSILTSVEEGQKIARADELGYFAFGQSFRVFIGTKLIIRWINDRTPFRERGSEMGRRPVGERTSEYRNPRPSRQWSGKKALISCCVVHLD